VKRKFILDLDAFVLYAPSTNPCTPLYCHVRPLHPRLHALTSVRALSIPVRVLLPPCVPSPSQCASSHPRAHPPHKSARPPGRRACPARKNVRLPIGVHTLHTGVRTLSCTHARPSRKCAHPCA
jgi:hypothetical protein